MTLQWTGDLHQIVDHAEHEASRMRVRMNTALLLRSMIKLSGPAQEILAAVGVNLEKCDSGIKQLPLRPEPGDAPQRVYDRAAHVCSKTRSDAVTSTQVLLAIMDEPCMGQSLLRGLQVDVTSMRALIFGYMEPETGVSVCNQVQRSISTSMNAVAVQRKSLSSHRSTTYIEPLPAASFGLNESHEDGLHALNRSRLITPEEIANLKKSNIQPSLPGIDALSSANKLQNLKSEDVRRMQSSASCKTHSAKVNAAAEILARASSTENRVSRASSTYRSSSREIQQETTLDLARRLKEKKTKTSEARRASREMPRTTETAAEQNENLAVQPKLTEEQPKLTNEMLANQAVAAMLGTQDIKSETSASPVKSAKAQCTNSASETPKAQAVQADAPVKQRPLPSSNPIITRQNAQSQNTSGSVYKRKSTAKLPAGFNPLLLSKQKFPTLCMYGRNLLAEANSGRIDPVIDREREIDQLIDVLNKRRSNNPILVGEAGVGKTAIIEGLALRMARQEAPRGLENRTIIALDYGSILCGTQLRGAVQERIKAIKNEINAAEGHIILFLDEIHSWFSSGTGDPNADAALELKLALSRGEIMCIGASTPQELRRAFNADPTFERRFDFIEVKAPDAETSVRIIEQGIINQYAAHHEVSYEPDAIREAVRLSERYIQERALPDKAISVLDRAGSICERDGEHTVTAAHVAKVIAQIAEVPVERLMLTEKQKLMQMETILGERLIGHDENIRRMANVIRRNHAGFGAQRPIGSFLFLGPTGVGKTEAAKVLADFLFGSPKNIVRFDMSEYMEQHSVAKLIGAPAGYVGFDDGGLLTEALRKRPYQIVLFDEIEKAHPDIMNIMLQILDEGRLTDAKGRHVDFSNTVIIMTSNLGAAEAMRAAQNGIGFAGNNAKLTADDIENIIIKSARSRFSPELWNRIEERLVFHALTEDQIKRIAHLLLNDSRKRLLTDKRIALSFDETALIPYLIQNGGFEPAYGARPMRKTIQSHIESKVAEWILEHDTTPQELYVGIKNGHVYVEEIEPL